MDNGTEYIGELLRQWGGWEMELQYGTGEQIDCWVRRQAASGEETGMIRSSTADACPSSCSSRRV